MYWEGIGRGDEGERLTGILTRSCGVGSDFYACRQ